MQVNVTVLVTKEGRNLCVVREDIEEVREALLKAEAKLALGDTPVWIAFTGGNNKAVHMNELAWQQIATIEEAQAEMQNPAGVSPLAIAQAQVPADILRRH